MQNMITLEDKLNENSLVVNENINYYRHVKNEREMYQALNKMQQSLSK